MKANLIVAIRSPLQMKDRRNAIRDTWGKAFIEHDAEVFFVVSGEVGLTSPELREDVLYTPGTNDHYDLTNRMIWLWRYIKSKEFTHVLVMDDDCSVNVPFFMSLPWSETEAWGHNSGGFLSGCAAVFSKNTISKLDENMGRDDVTIGALLTQLKVKMIHAMHNGKSCAVHPWGGSNDVSPHVAIHHYVRSPQQIIENHSKLKKYVSLTTTTTTLSPHPLPMRDPLGRPVRSKPAPI